MTARLVRHTWLAVAALAALAACGGESISGGEAPQIEVTTAGRVIAHDSTLEIDLDAPAFVTLRNTGSAPLEIYSLTLGGQDPGSFDLDLQVVPTDEEPVVIHPETSDEQPKLWAFEVGVGTLQAGNASPRAEVEIITNAMLSGTDRHSFLVTPSETFPVAVADPAVVNFSNVPVGESGTANVVILNGGGADLKISRVFIAGNPGFSVDVDGESVPVSPQVAAQGVEVDWTIAPSSSRQVDLAFESLDAVPATGTLTFTTNDTSLTDGALVVPLQANTDAPCISITPNAIDFAGKRIGNIATIDATITSCGDSDLVISDLNVTGQDADLFSLTTPTITQFPATLAPGASAPVTVTYVPIQVAPRDDEGWPIYDEARIVATTNALLSEVSVPVKGFGTTTDCPTAVIIIPEGEEVIPQTNLHLTGSTSYGATPIKEYLWEVEQPDGSQSRFVSSNTIADPTFETNVAGPYKFTLTVWDEAGFESCVPATAEVIAIPDEAIHVELIWDTPNDPDQSNEGPVAGADLDLHFAHPFANGEYDGDGDGKDDPWFDTFWDVFWDNTDPNWGSLDNDVDDNPGLDRDDTDGAGPENLNLAIPEDDKTYDIGVHYWNSHGWGVSYATLRVYIYATLTFEVTEVEMYDRDFWWAAQLEWPSGAVIPTLDDNGSRVITVNYDHPDYLLPAP